MISVLIPLFQVNVHSLINSLIEQLSTASISYEILIGDDSPSPLNSSTLDEWRSCNLRYFHNSSSLGRSANRNMLADNAIYENLIFIDCDALLPNPDFISKYIKEIDGKSVLCGGTNYQNTKPAQKEQVLRWTYGRKREVSSATNRNINPYNSFSSFNFCIPTQVFKEVRFDERIKDYGHEDTYFGFDLKERGVLIKHIENPLTHNGLESSDVFLEKTKIGIEGLLSISRRETVPDGFLEHNTLWLVSERMKKSGLSIILKVLYPFLERYILVFLRSRNPSMFLFDLYKLAYLSRIQD
ncbi:MAG: glycosyltransferase [Bacteroidales bacterium]|nr:glycosyltransferase [Bacteroidales bacterium]